MPAEILAHPRFAVARACFVDGILALYEGDALLTRLMGEAARGVIFLVLVCLEAGHDEDDPSTWLTLGRLKQQLEPYGLSSPRHIEGLVSLLVHNGFLESIPSQSDRRLRFLRATGKMLSVDHDWLVANYQPLQSMFPDPGYDEVLRRDPAFRRVLRRVAIDSLANGARILGGNPEIMMFHERDAGILILFNLAQLAGGPDGRPAEFDYKETGARFGVSRTHVQKILQDAESAGLLAITGRGRRCVSLTPAIWAALDRFTAESLSGHDLVFAIAKRGIAHARSKSQLQQTVVTARVR